MNVTRLINTDKLKAEIADALPISKVAEELCDCTLTQAGHQYKTLCPLHGEDTPSFYVNDTKGAFHCFGCKEGGDSIALVRSIHHIGYHEALVMLAEHAGIDIAAYQRPPTPEEKEKDAIRTWAEAWLAGLPYDESRVSGDVAVQYGNTVPMTPSGPIPPFLRDKSYLFEGTALFPYRKPNGTLVGWKVRHPDKRMFLTPSGFPLWEPTLYGIQVARPHIVGGRVNVVEGEYDCEVLFDHGIYDVVASGGSALTDEHMALLDDLKVREIVCWYDGDEGGEAAAESTAKRYWNHPTIRVRVTVGPTGGDPEDLVRAAGAEMAQAQLDRAPDALEWLLRREFNREPRQTLGQRMDFIKWVQREYGSQLTGLQEAVVLRQVAVWLDVPDADVMDFARAEKTLLQAVDSEKVILGRAIRNSNYFMTIRRRVARDDFFVIKHQRLWDVLTALVMDGMTFDPVVIKRHSEGQGISPEYIELLAETGDTNIGWHEDQVIDFSVRRGTQADADRFRNLISDLSLPSNQVIGGLTHAVTSKALGRHHGAARAVAEQVDEAMDTLHERCRNPDRVTGLDTGSQFPQMIKLLDGFQPRRLVMIAATSGAGKSTLGLQWMTSLAVLRSVPCDFISLEMDTDEILYKQASHLTGIDSLKISGGRVDADELRQVERAMAILRKAPMRIHAPDGITPSEITLYAREAVMDRRSELFLVDYAQMVGPDPEVRQQSRYEQLGHFAYMMKQKVARGLDVGVICCAQLKRDAAGKDEPTPEDMGDSYELVRASDVIFLIGQPDKDAQPELWIGKNRQGPAGQLIPIYYDKPANTMREALGTKRPEYTVA